MLSILSNCDRITTLGCGNKMLILSMHEMRGIVRRDLHDEDALNYRWTDNEIDRHIAQAIKTFSLALPYQQKATLATTSGSREISLASLSNKVAIDAVEYPAGQYPACYVRFSIWGDTLTIHGQDIPDGSNCYIYYGQLHTLSTTSTIPSIHEDMIACGACGYAAVEWALYANDQVNNGGNETVIRMLELAAKLFTRFDLSLKKIGGNNKVRIRQLYKSYYPAESKVTDWGP